jgi:hypothetical protein
MDVVSKYQANPWHQLLGCLCSKPRLRSDGPNSKASGRYGKEVGDPTYDHDPFKVEAHITKVTVKVIDIVE